MNLPLFNKFGVEKPIYSFTTENLEYILKLPTLNKKIALTLTGSGDQAILLSSLNFEKIINLDINSYANFYSQLKINALSYLSLDEFKDFFLHEKNCLNFETFLKIKPSLNQEAQLFWNHVYQQYSYNGVLLKRSHYFTQHPINKKEIIKNCIYLQNKKIYQTLQKNIRTCEFIYVQNNILDYINSLKSDESNFLYDCIILSNLADYSHKMFNTQTHLMDFKDKVIHPLFKRLNHNGIIMFGYVYDALNLAKSDQRNSFNDPKIRHFLYQDLGNIQEISMPSTIPEVLEDRACFLSRSQ